MKSVKKMLNKKLIAVCMIAILCISSSLTAYADTDKTVWIGTNSSIGALCTVAKKSDGGVSALAVGSVKDVTFTVEATYYVSGSSLARKYTTTHTTSKGHYNDIVLTKAEVLGLYEGHPSLDKATISSVKVRFDLNAYVATGSTATQLVTGSITVN